MKTRPTIRTLAAVSLAISASLTLVVLLALVGGSAALKRAMDTVTRDTRSAAIAGELAVAALMHQRLSNLLVVTGEPEIREERDLLAEQMRRLLVEAAELVGAEEERQLLGGVAARLEDYLAQRRRAESRGLPLDQVVRQVRPAFSDVLTDLRRLRELNDAQVERARAESTSVDRLATRVGAAAGVLLIVGLLGIALGVRRYVVQPVVSLYGAMARFNGGDVETRADIGGVREMAELARMFSDMAANLGQQRKAQLTFLAGVAHDLKSPLATLKTGMYVLEHEPSELRRSDTRASLDRQVDLLNRMVDDLLDATRIEAGQLELRPGSFDLRPLVQDVVRLYVPAAPEHQLTVNLADEPVVVDADALRIEQVIRNLVSNAIKFSPYGGQVVLDVARAGGHALLTVADQGIGIPEEDLQNIFLPFRRRKVNAVPGAGLGLSVVRRILSAHGGSIEVESRPGEGTTFRVKLPLAETSG